MPPRMIRGTSRIRKHLFTVTRTVHCLLLHEQLHVYTLVKYELAWCGLYFIEQLLPVLLYYSSSLVTKSDVMLRSDQVWELTPIQLWYQDSINLYYLLSCDLINVWLQLLVWYVVLFSTSIFYDRSEDFVESFICISFCNYICPAVRLHAS
jgi:hypothetical protein